VSVIGKDFFSFSRILPLGVVDLFHACIGLQEHSLTSDFGFIPLLPLYLSLQQGESLGDDELQAMIDEFDSTGAGEIDEKDFLKIMKQTSIY
jgi:hypothetical protein